MSRQDWWDEEPLDEQPGERHGDTPASRKGSWFLALLGAFFFAMLFSVGLDQGLRLLAQGRVSALASWTDRIDLVMGVGLAFLGGSVGLSVCRLGHLRGAGPAVTAFFLALSGMAHLLLLQSGLMQRRVHGATAADLQTWLQGRDLAVYGLALFGLLLAWILPFRSRSN